MDKVIKILKFLGGTRRLVVRILKTEDLYMLYVPRKDCSYIFKTLFPLIELVAKMTEPRLLTGKRFMNPEVLRIQVRGKVLRQPGLVRLV